MKSWLTWLAWCLMATVAQAATLTYNASNVVTVGIPILITDTANNPLTGQTLADVDAYYSCGTTNYQFAETGDTLTEVSAGLRPGEYVWTSDDAVAVNCPEPKVLTISGGGTDRDVWGAAPFDMTNGTLDAAEVAADVSTEIWAFPGVELTQSVPPATPTMTQAMMALYMCLFRSEVLTTSTTVKCKNDAGTVIFSRSASDDGTTFTRGEMGSGP